LEVLGKETQYCKTDPDATFMRMKECQMKNGQLKPSYKPQLSTENQFITHVSVRQTPDNSSTLASNLDGFEKSCEKNTKKMVADAGCGSEEKIQPHITFT
jgi:hypothetical protein